MLEHTVSPGVPRSDPGYMRAWAAANSAHKKAVDREGYLARRRALHASNPALSLLDNAKQRAKKKGLPFSITLSDIVVPDVCPVFGIPLVTSIGKGFSASSPSLDRVIPSLGYVPGNVRVISARANTIKNDATADELRAVLAYVEDATRG